MLLFVPAAGAGQRHFHLKCRPCRQPGASTHPIDVDQAGLAGVAGIRGADVLLRARGRVVVLAKQAADCVGLLQLAACTKGWGWGATRWRVGRGLLVHRGTDNAAHVLHHSTLGPRSES